MKGKSDTLVLFVIITAGVLIRGAFIISCGNNIRWEDEYHYDRLAVGVSNTLFQTHYTAFKPDAQVSGYDNLDLGRPPLYPLILSTAYAALGHSPIAGRFMNIFFYIFTALCIFNCSKMVCKSTTSSLLTVALFSVDPVSGYITATLLTESLYTALTSGAILLLLWVYRSARPLAIGGTGLLCGGALLARESFLSFLPVAFIWITAIQFRRFKITKALKYCTLFLLPIVILVSMRTAYNYYRYNVFVPVASTKWVNVFLGNNPGVTPSTRGIISYALSPGLQQRLNEARSDMERESAYKQEALAWIRSHPIDFISLTMQKMVLFWSVIPLHRNDDPVDRARALALLLFFTPVFIGALLGISRNNGCSTEKSLIITWIASVNITCALIFFSERFRAPVMPFVELLAAVPLSNLFVALRIAFLHILHVRMEKYFPVDGFSPPHVSDR